MSGRFRVVVRLAMAAALGPLGMALPMPVRWPTRRRPGRIEAKLQAHLAGLGISAEPQNVTNTRIQSREHQDRATLRQLANIRIWLPRITSIEVWRITRKGKNLSTVDDELTFVARLEQGLTLTRIPILTSTTRVTAPDGEGAFEWHGFPWGNLPLVADRLRADDALNQRLERHFTEDIPGNLRIRALPSNRISVSIPYDPQRLPSREALDCFEDIVQHVNDYVAARNRAREEDTRRLALRLSGWRPEKGDRP